MQTDKVAFLTWVQDWFMVSLPIRSKRILVQGKLEVAGNEGHEQAWKADHTVVPL